MSVMLPEISGESAWRVTVKVDGIDLGTWDKLDGGDTDSNASKYKPGGSRKTVPVLGGRTDTGDVTLTKGFDRAEWDLYRALRGRSGLGKVEVRQVPLDGEGNPDGKPAIGTGKLKTVMLPKYDSTSDNASTVGLVVTAFEWSNA